MDRPLSEFAYWVGGSRLSRVLRSITRSNNRDPRPGLIQPTGLCSKANLKIISTHADPHPITSKHREKQGFHFTPSTCKVLILQCIFIQLMSKQDDEQSRRGKRNLKRGVKKKKRGRNKNQREKKRQHPSRHRCFQTSNLPPFLRSCRMPSTLRGRLDVKTQALRAETYTICSVFNS